MEVTTGSMLAAACSFLPESMLCVRFDSACCLRPAVSSHTLPRVNRQSRTPARSCRTHHCRRHDLDGTRRRVTPTALGDSARRSAGGSSGTGHPFRRPRPSPPVSTGARCLPLPCPPRRCVVSPSGGHDAHACTDPVCSLVLRSADAGAVQYRFANGML